MNVPAKAAPEGDVMEAVIAKGDLAKLTPDQRVQYYQAVCKSLGINALTQPLSYITLNGKLTLYATRACTDQLRKIHNVSLEVVSRQLADDILTVRVKAHTPDGRVDEDLGAVPFPSTLKGEAHANAVLKAVTKAKRRVTLSICGLGWLDETEVESISDVALPPYDPQTGEITESADDVDATHDAADAAPLVVGSVSGAAVTLETMAREAAKRGAEAMRVFWRNRSKEEQAQIDKIRKDLNKLVDDAEARIAMELDTEGPSLDDHSEQHAVISAFRAGQEAKSRGYQRKAMPGELRDPKRNKEATAWEAGFDGEPAPFA